MAPLILKIKIYNFYFKNLKNYYNKNNYKNFYVFLKNIEIILKKININSYSIKFLNFL